MENSGVMEPDPTLQSFTLAEDMLKTIDSAGSEISAVSQRILKGREELFQEALILQLSGISQLSGVQASLPVGTRYALMLASSVLDHLLQGWRANLAAYYRVSLSLLRIIHESTVFELAVSVDNHALQQWLKGKLRVPEARPKVVAFLKGMATDLIADTWAANQQRKWRELHKFAHASWEGITAPAARVRTKSGTPLYSPAGRILNPALCFDLGLEYVKAATDAVVTMRLTFSPLDQAEQWRARQKSYLALANAELLKECKIDEGVLRHVKETLGE
jgi:hypothetical protein